MLYVLCFWRFYCFYNVFILFWQPPWLGRFTWEEVLVLAPSVGSTVGARGMEAVHLISARAVVLLPVTFYNSCRTWTLSTLTRKGELLFPWCHLLSSSLLCCYSWFSIFVYCFGWHCESWLKMRCILSKIMSIILHTSNALQWEILLRLKRGSSMYLYNPWLCYFVYHLYFFSDMIPLS